MSFPWSIRTAIPCPSNSSPSALLDAAALRFESAGAAVKHRTTDSFTIEPGNRPLGRHWMAGVSDGQVRVVDCEEQRLLQAEIGYPLPLVIGTLAAAVLVVVADWQVAVGAWAWLVGGNYALAVFAVRRHLIHARLAAASQAT